MIIKPDFLPDHLRSGLEAVAAVAPEGAFGSIILDGGEYRHVLDEVDAASVIADVRVRVGGEEHPTMDETILQIQNDRPMVVVVVKPEEGRVTSVAWGDFLLDYPLEGRPFIYGLFDCYEALRAWRWQQDRVRLIPLPRPPFGWWRLPTFNNPNAYMKWFKFTGYSEFMAANPAAEGGSETHLAPMVGDGLLIQPKELKIVSHAAVYIGDGNVFHHFQDRKSEVCSLNSITRKMVVRKWLRRTELLYPDAQGEKT